MNDKFWAVWRETGGSAPSRRHDTKESAIQEAGRLARQTNERYFVLEAIGIVAPIEVPVQYSEIRQ